MPARFTSSGEASNQRTTSPRTTCARSLRPSTSKFWRRIARPRAWWSTNVTPAAPRDSASMPSAPEPAKRSSTCAPSVPGPTRLKMACLTIPWVGLMPFGVLSLLPLASPPLTLSPGTLAHPDRATAGDRPYERRPVGLGAQRSLELRRLERRDGDQQAPAGLRVAQPHLVDLPAGFPVALVS